MEYEVRWVTQVDAESPEEAAKLAAEMQRDPSTLAIVFEVVAEEYSDDPNVQYKTIEVPWPSAPTGEYHVCGYCHGTGRGFRKDMPTERVVNPEKK
jgi:hypothetical protein